MTEERKKEIEYNGFTIKAIAIGLIAALVLTVYYAPGNIFQQGSWFRTRGTHPGYFSLTFSNHDPYIFMQTMGAISLILLVIAVVNQIGKKPVFSRMEAAVITLLTPLCIFVQAAFGNPLGMQTFFTHTFGVYASGYDYETIWPLISPILGPKDIAIYDAILPPNAPVNWGAWTPTLFWAILFSVSIIFTFLFAALIVRRVWLDVEAIPFPTATYHLELIELTQRDETDRVKFFRSKYFLIGLLISVIWLFPTHLQMWWRPVTPYPMVDGVPDQRLGVAWPNGPYVLPWWGLTKEVSSVLPYVSLIINIMPWAIGWGFLNSMPNIIGLLLTALVLTFIVPLAMYSMGYLLPPAYNLTQDQQVYYGMLRGLWGFGGAANIPWGYLIFLGMLLGIFVYPVWRHRDRFASIFKSLITSPPREVDAESPLPYRYIWIGLIGSFIVWVACGAALNVPILTYLLYAIIVLVFLMALVRVFCETGGNFMLLGQWGYHFSWPVIFGSAMVVAFGLYGSVSAASLAALVVLTEAGAIFLYTIRWAWESGWLSLHAFKTAGIAKVKSKTLLKFVALTIVIVMIVGFVTDLLVIHWVKLDMPPATFEQRVIFWDAREFPIAYSELQKPDSISVHSVTTWLFPALTTHAHVSIMYLAIGFALIIAVYLLRARFPWFVIGPAGVALGVIFGIQLWSSWLLALIIKYLVIKVGGMKLYREKAQPFFIACLFSYFLVLFLGTLGVFVRVPHLLW